MLFITLRKFPSVPSLLRALVMTDNAFYPVLFLHLLQCTVFLLYSVNVVNYFGFQILNQPCIPGINNIKLFFKYIANFDLIIFC